MSPLRSLVSFLSPFHADLTYDKAGLNALGKMLAQEKGIDSLERHKLFIFLVNARQPVNFLEQMYNFMFRAQDLDLSPRLMVLARHLVEPVIAKDPGYAYEYASLVLRAPFPAGEPAIATEAKLARRYAMNVLHAPFPLGESAIASDYREAADYEEIVLRGRPWSIPNPLKSK